MRFTRPDPKPARREKEPRKGLKRSWMKRRTSRREARKTADDRRYLEDVHCLPCVLWIRGECSGVKHAHHAGKRPGVGMKAPDDTAIPFCSRHHDDWHGALGYFSRWTRLARRQWADAQIAITQLAIKNMRYLSALRAGVAG